MHSIFLDNFVWKALMEFSCCNNVTFVTKIVMLLEEYVLNYLIAVSFIRSLRV